jgi:hypothetical protein
VALNRRLAAALLAATVGLFAGCGSDGPKLYPVTAKVVVDGGNVADMVGSTIEAMNEADTTIRASGTIEADGTVVLETLHAGKIRKGAQEGTYQARIILSDDDTETRRKAAKAVAPKYRNFKTSGWSFQVPPPGEVTLKLTPR